MSKTHKKSGSSHHRSGGHEVFTQTLNIVVERGDPVDAQSTRHTAFFIEYSDGRNILSHVTGGSGFFELEERWDTTQPSESCHFERMIPVATVQTSTANDLTIRNIIYGTSINNDERAWNCQSWIGDGLKRLQEAELISAGITRSAVDQMVDVLMEAPDED